MTNSPITNMFVYGTLKRGQCREHCWPHQPVEIRPALVRGYLYDLGPYPAMVSGDDWVAGEVWSIRDEDLGQTLLILDEIEDYDASRVVNLYNRVEVVWFASNQQPQPSGIALAYHYAILDRLANRPRLQASDAGIVHWPAAAPTS